MSACGDGHVTIKQKHGCAAVTVILSTYNRSNALAFAIRTVLWQTWADWELLVIGDACSDDSARVATGFNDPRIRWINLPRRIGDQSGPNNRGLQEARGQYLAFLNHDDLWFPDHLERCLEELEKTGADIVFPFALEVFPNGGICVGGVYPGDVYHPLFNPPICTWVMRRAFGERFGPFRARGDCYGLPTQNLLFRGWRQGSDMRVVSAATAIQITSATRVGVYSQRQVHEQAEWFQRMSQDARLREKAWAEAWQSPRPMHLRGYRTKALLRALAFRAIGRISLWFGLEPAAVFFQISFRKVRGWLPRKGVVFEELYRRRGLEAFEKEQQREKP